MLTADQHANGGNSSVRTTKAAKRRWPYLFCQPPLAGWNPSFLATSGTFCSWSGWVAAEAGSLPQFTPFLVFWSSCLSSVCLCVCFPFTIASQAILGLRLICPSIFSFLRWKVHPSVMGDGTQALPRSLGGLVPCEVYSLLLLLSVLPEISQLTLRCASWEAKLLFERISGLTEARSW